MELDFQTYRELIVARYALWVEYMCGRVEARSVPRWPDRPVRVSHPRPEIVWHYRPPQVPKDSPCPSYYDLRYRPCVDVGGVKFRRGTGRNISGRATRNGRINWPETTARAQAWQDTETSESTHYENTLRAIQNEVGTSALRQLPSVDFPYQAGMVKVIRIPKGGYNCMKSYHGDVTISDLHIWHGNVNHTAKEAVGVHNLPRDFVAQVLAAVSERWGGL